MQLLNDADSMEAKSTMAVEAPLSRYKKNNLLIMAVLLIGLGIWFYYDGYHNAAFIAKHTQQDGSPDSTLNFNRKAPPFIIGGGIVLAIYLAAIRGRKIIADDTALRCGRLSIAYDAIEQINKTHFSSKGFFVITYNDQGQRRQLKLSDRMYDNLPAVLDYIAAKIQ